MRRAAITGDAWPGARLDWSIREDGGGARHGRAAFDPDPDSVSWRTRVTLALPSLGIVEAELTLVGATLAVRVHASATGAARLAANGDALHGRMAAAGIELGGLPIREIDGAVASGGAVAARAAKAYARAAAVSGSSAALSSGSSSGTAFDTVPGTTSGTTSGTAADRYKARYNVRWYSGRYDVRYDARYGGRYNVPYGAGPRQTGRLRFRVADGVRPRPAHAPRRRFRPGASMSGPPRRHAAALVHDAPADAAAPRVVAKGYGIVAEMIVRRATEAGLYVHEAPEMVSLLMQVDLDARIPPRLYRALAELLAWLHRLETAGSGAGPPPPRPPVRTAASRGRPP